MEKNNSKFSISDAMKIYGGDGLVIHTCITWSVFTLIFLGLYAAIRITVAVTVGRLISPDDSEVIGGISRTNFTIFMAGVGIIGTSIIQVQEFYKESAGGKYFRSVCGGFDTYSRMKTGQMLQCICGHALFAVLVFLADTVFNLVSSCLGVCATVFLVSLSGTAVVRLICMIKNRVAKILLLYGFSGVHSFICACIVGETDGQFSSVHIVFLIIALISLPLVHFADLKNYRQYYWYD